MSSQERQLVRNPLFSLAQHGNEDERLAQLVVILCDACQRSDRTSLPVHGNCPLFRIAAEESRELGLRHDASLRCQQGG